MNPDDDIDPDKVRVTGKLEAHFPGIPNPEDYGPMDTIVKYMREHGLTIDRPNLMQIPRACRTVTNFFQQGDNANRWLLQTWDSHDGVIESQRIQVDTREHMPSRLLNLAEGTYQGRTVQEFMRHHVGEPWSLKQGEPMTKFEVFNSSSGHSFGIYEADTPEAAIEACCRDAGYASKAQAEEAMGRESQLVAKEVS